MIKKLICTQCNDTELELSNWQPDLSATVIISPIKQNVFCRNCNTNFVLEFELKYWE